MKKTEYAEHFLTINCNRQNKKKFALRLNKDQEGNGLWFVPEVAGEQASVTNPLTVCAANDDSIAESTGSIQDGQLNDRINQSSAHFLW